VPFVKKAVSIPVAFDPLVSRYMTKVFDRKTIWKYSPRALKNYIKDKRAFKYSDLILADTASHKEYYCSRFGVDPGKIIVIPIGVNTGDFYPLETSRDKNDTTLVVGFYGTFIPLHGIEKIIMAAHELRDRKDIRFDIFGTGPLAEKISLLARKLHTDNIEFRGWVNYNDLQVIINNMDICLGIFGESIKTELVIPNKIFHYTACGKPVITRDTKGIREIFTPEKDIIVSSNEPSEIAEKILLLADDPDRRKKIGRNALDLVQGKYNEMEITKSLVASFETLLRK